MSVNCYGIMYFLLVFLLFSISIYDASFDHAARLAEIC